MTISGSVKALLFSTTLLVGMTSCGGSETLTTKEELTTIRESIAPQQSKYVQLCGVLKLMSSRFKDNGLLALSIESEKIYFHEMDIREIRDRYVDKTIKCKVKISHLPLVLALSDSEPGHQKQGHWITEISDIEVVD